MDLLLVDSNIKVAQPIKLLLSANFTRMSKDGYHPEKKNPKVSVQCAVDSELQGLLERFWEQKEMRLSDPWTKGKRVCEERFIRTFRRISDWKFIVRLSFETSSEFEETRPIAMRVLASMTHHLLKDSAFFEAYQELDLRHMSLFQATSSAHCFLSHYGFVRADRVTTKLQVVFNSSNIRDIEGRKDVKWLSVYRSELVAVSGRCFVPVKVLQIIDMKWSCEGCGRKNQLKNSLWIP